MSRYGAPVLFIESHAELERRIAARCSWPCSGHVAIAIWHRANAANRAAQNAICRAIHESRRFRTH